MVTRIVALIAVLHALAVPSPAANGCSYWRAQVVAGAPRVDVPTFDTQSDTAVLAGIECLLSMERERGRAAFGGATRMDVSQIDPVPPAAVAALYTISKLVYPENEHIAETVTLVDKDGRINRDAAIKAAYRAYRAWFAHIKEVGLARARAEDTNPLASTSVRWR